MGLVLLEIDSGLVNGCLFLVAEDGKDPANSDAPENNPQYTTVYVGNLAPEVRYFSDTSLSEFCL